MLGLVLGVECSSLLHRIQLLLHQSVLVLQQPEVVGRGAHPSRHLVVHHALHGMQLLLHHSQLLLLLLHHQPQIRHLRLLRCQVEGSWLEAALRHLAAREDELGGV